MARDSVPQNIPVFLPNRKNTYEQQAYRWLSTLLKKDTIPHALLFRGIEGVGKRTAATAFAMACNCMAAGADGRKIPCGKCQSCGKIVSGNHPDIRLVERTGNVIRIADIRDVLRMLSMKPNEARTRIVVIAEANYMNPEASNALLKVLEEPPDRTVIILTAPEASDLLPTIVSRCQSVRFGPIRRDHIERFLIETAGADDDEARILAPMANGSFSKALQTAGAKKRKSWIGKRDRLIHAGGLDAAGPDEPKSLAAQLAFAETLARNKNELQDSLELMKTWLRDLIVYRFSPGKIVNRDLSHTIGDISKKMSVDSLLSKIEAIQSAQKALMSNTNLRLTLEIMALRIAKSE